MVLSTHLYCNHCGAANQTQDIICFACQKPLHAGSLISAATGLLAARPLLKQRYCIIRQVGQGGMGAVYQAEDTQLGNRLVAVKEMSQSSLSQQELVTATEAFKREAHLLAGLSHPNLPSIYDHFDHAGRWYLVMSFIEGETLED